MAGLTPGKAAAVALGIPAAVLVGLKLRYPTIRDDIAFLRVNMALFGAMKEAMDKNQTVINTFEEHARNIPNKPFIFFQDECHTFGQVDRDANKMARFAQESGQLKLGDTVAFLISNSPLYISSFLAFSKLGIAASFLNYNLKHHALLHCIEICEAKVILCSKEFIPRLQDIQDDLQRLGIDIWVVGYEDTAPPPGMLVVNTRDVSADPISQDIRKNITVDDPSVYMYTSGTTGLPKAVILKHSRMIKAMFLTYPCQLRSDDVIYNSLPIYHGASFGMGIGSAIRMGCSVVIAPKFSASHFWDDVRRYRATVIQYIGELCRYLLAQPPSDKDGKYDHRVRIAVGNGLRPDIWAEFKNRFNIEHIREFYAATEGNFMTMNIDDKEGTVGRYPRLIHDILGNAQLIQCDMATAEPIRGKNSHCIPVPPGETGLLVTKIDEFFSFDGYKASKETNEKKIIRDVIKKEDKYFNTGDLLIIDKNGYVYFCDRLGDTFRWKGENVATTEVAEELNKFASIVDSNVYGVQVPGHDGRAGMAAITLKEGAHLHLQQLYQHVKENLPMYACPKFLRILPEVIITSTFKHKKTDLVKEGYDPAVVSDPLYFMDVAKETYVPLDQQIFKSVVIGKAKL